MNDADFPFSDSEDENITIEKFNDVQTDINYKQQEKHSPHINALKIFMNNTKFINNSGDPTTNITDRMASMTENGYKGKSYNIPKKDISKFFKLYEHARINNAIMCINEKQYTQDIKESGIMFDFDIIQDVPISQVNKHVFVRFSTCIAYILSKYIDMKNPIYEEHHIQDNNKYRMLYVCFTRKKTIVRNEEKDYYKMGFMYYYPV